MCFMPYFKQFKLNNGVFITTRIISCFAHLFDQTPDLLQISIYARSVQRRLAFLIPLVPLRNNQSKNWWRRQKQRWYDCFCKGTTISPFLPSSSLTPSCHNPPTHHLENIEKNHIRQTKSEFIYSWQKDRIPVPNRKGWHRLPESERMTSLSLRGSLLSISSSSSSSPSLPSGCQPSAAHSSRSLASVSSAFDELHRLWNASQSLNTRFCWEQKFSLKTLQGVQSRTLQQCKWVVTNFSAFSSTPGVWPAQTSERSARLYCSCRLHPRRNSHSPPELLQCSATCYIPDKDTSDSCKCILVQTAYQYLLLL